MLYFRYWSKNTGGNKLAKRITKEIPVFRFIWYFRLFCKHIFFCFVFQERNGVGNKFRHWATEYFTSKLRIEARRKHGLEWSWRTRASCIVLTSTFSRMVEPLVLLNLLIENDYSKTHSRLSQVSLTCFVDNGVKEMICMSTLMWARTLRGWCLHALRYTPYTNKIIAAVSTTR